MKTRRTSRSGRRTFSNSGRMREVASKFRRVRGAYKNLNKNDLHNYYEISDSFLSAVLQIWSEISFNGNITSNKQCRSINLWHKSLIKVGNSPIYYKTWATKGVREVRHLTKDENSFLSLAEFRERFNIKINYLTFHGITAAIRPQRKLLL